MCGRYVVADDPQTLVSGFSVTPVTPFPRRWNVTPQSPAPVDYETREGERVAMAGRFEAWRPNESEEWPLTCCVITVAANALTAPIHDRMPARLAPLLVPCPPETLQAWPVSRAVSRGTAEGEALIAPLPQGPAA